MCSNIPASPAYGVYISQLIRYARVSSNYSQYFMKIHLLLSFLQKVLTKRSSSYTIWFQMRCWMTSCLNHNYLILIFLHFLLHMVLTSRNWFAMQGPVAIILISWNLIFIWEADYWTRAIKIFTLFDLLKSLYSDTKILLYENPSFIIVSAERFN
jgi:ABC-type proline/glycine betaine transport system permease subunit